MDIAPYTVPAEIAAHPAWHRLESQQAYYSKTSGRYQTHYKRIKLGLIGLSTAIPLLVFLPGEIGKFAAAVAGVLIALLEGLLLLNQYGLLWVNYRAVAEALKRERWLLLSRAGDYAGLADDDALRLLAARVEAILQAENGEWVGDQRQSQSTLADTRAWADAQHAAQAS